MTSTDPPADVDAPGGDDLLAPAASGEPLSVKLASRFGISVRHIVVVAIALALALVLGTAVLARARPRSTAIPVSSSPPTQSQPATGQPAAGQPAEGQPVEGQPADGSAVQVQAGTATTASVPAPTAVVLVDVVGKVRHPGVVSLPAGARVQDALAAVGGAKKGVDLATLNQARPVVDGEQIMVGMASALPPAIAAGTSDLGATPPAPAVVNLNTATQAELESLPDVGPVTAQRIIDFRAQNGRFASIDDLREITGIGAKTFAEIAPHVRV